MDSSYGQTIRPLSVGQDAGAAQKIAVRVDSVDPVLPDTKKTSLRLSAGTAWWQLSVRITGGQHSGLDAAALLRAFRLQGSVSCFAAIDFSATDPADVRSVGSGKTAYKTVAVSTSQTAGRLVIGKSALPMKLPATELRIVFVMPLDDGPNGVFWVNTANIYQGSWTSD